MYTTKNNTVMNKNNTFFFEILVHCHQYRDYWQLQLKFMATSQTPVCICTTYQSRSQDDK